MQTSRPTETATEEAQSAPPESYAQRTAAAAGNDAEATLQNSASQISRAYSGGETAPADTRAASEAYRAEASARDQLAEQKRGNGTRTLDVLA